MVSSTSTPVTVCNVICGEAMRPRYYSRGVRVGNFPRSVRIAVTTNGTAESAMSTILLVILILLLVGALPTWPHSRSWGYAPSGLLGVVLVVLLILLLLGRI
jgi:hypothetical protein